MSWTQARALWPQLSASLCQRFRHLNPTAMARFRGDRAKLNLYLAQTHDLTLAEAAQALDDWLAFSIATPDLQAAA
ncbi:hypothetical protein [Octadecabacter ascidiaceicola]|uniref:Uncharacterized protein n=1 Tax=Octadecabacter ascidiaceicola TaxID=1655543 RepID=A0A238JL88_9RHOB|nr:hypothetical protein [Octadecabacter ascidiaceicola]SMX31163.1 hypothetical protein OCA8868_00222 [Octadecabacter ascidiaceicola]